MPVKSILKCVIDLIQRHLQDYIEKENLSFVAANQDQSCMAPSVFLFFSSKKLLNTNYKFNYISDPN